MGMGGRGIDRAHGGRQGWDDVDRGLGGEGAGKCKGGCKWKG